MKGREFAAGYAAALVDVLEARFGKLHPATVTAIAAHGEAAWLRSRLRRAAVATHVRDVCPAEQAARLADARVARIARVRELGAEALEEVVERAAFADSPYVVRRAKGTGRLRAFAPAWACLLETELLSAPDRDPLLDLRADQRVELEEFRALLGHCGSAREPVEAAVRIVLVWDRDGTRAALAEAEGLAGGATKTDARRGRIEWSP